MTVIHIIIGMLNSNPMTPQGQQTLPNVQHNP